MIRRFQIRDLPGVLNIEKQSFGVDAWPADLFREYARECPRLFFVARVGRVVAGYSITCIARNTADIASIAVLPEFRGRRIASKLLTRSIAKVRRQGVRAVTLMVRRDNRGAIDLYRKLGFLRTHTVHGYYADGAVAWRMRLGVTAPR